VPMPALRPALELCKPTGITLDERSRVVVMLDQGGVGTALINRLEKRGVTCLIIEEAPATDALAAKIEGWLSEGPIQGVYWLPALDVEPNLEDMDLGTFRELNRQRVKNLYTTMRALYDSVSGPNNFLVSATRLGGLHGYDAAGATAPLGGAVTGFTKAYKREHGDVLVKAVDFEPTRKTVPPAEALINETLTDPGIVEVGYRTDDERITVTLVEQPAADGQPGLTLNNETVFVVTGAAGGITSAIVADLAQASGGIFYLLDLVPAPDRDSDKIRLFRTDQEALKQQLIAEGRAEAEAAGERFKPAMIDRMMSGVERAEAALRAIETVEAAGGTAHYRSVNLIDGAAVTAVVDEIRANHGRIDALVHAGGLEISRTLPDKDAAQFNLVFDVKADGFFSLLRAAKDMPIGATVAFSSVAGRFGNSGQTDYSAANDLLCKISSSMRRWRPETRAIAIDWTAWGGIGMATRGSIPKIMEMAGIDMLPPESGIPTVRRELVAGGFRGEIVVAQRLGIMSEEFDPTGGLDLTQANATLEPQVGTTPRLLMVERITAAKLYGGLQVETTLDPNAQAFLYDHQMDDTPLLPGVMGTEAFAQIASIAAPGYTVAAVENEDFQAPFKFYRMEPQTLYLSATLRPADDGQLIAQTVLRSIRELPSGPQEKTHFVADVRLIPTAAEGPTLTAPTVNFSAPAPESLSITADKIYELYFHGPAYQVLERAEVNGAHAVGLMAEHLPANSDPEDVASLLAPRLIELCFQTAGIWEMRTKGRMALPLAIGSVTAYRQPEDAAGQRLYAVITSVNDGESFDAQVVDSEGRVFVTMTGYRTVALPGQVSL
ncbi:MAG: SDR family NAD(P)-dependent oxidoreductase, partial [Chloroflexi bacterium]|nr:SDR family NAD(P)-dependent oxidoreductase [Chloroflexota bacterium]